MKDMISAGDVLDILDEMQTPEGTEADLKLHEAYQKVGLLWDARADDGWEKVVRCKDCIHFRRNHGIASIYNKTHGHCDKYKDSEVVVFNYCSYGKAEKEENK